MGNGSFIIKKPQLLPSQDYAFLRQQGLEHIERLAHRLWTDYNIHDPGITILELLCYAVTDLGYRTGHDIRDLLTENDQGVPVNRSNFHTALEIFPCNPVSFSDLRKLLIDVNGVRNAWIEAHQSVEYCVHQQDQELIDCPGIESPEVTKNPPLNGLFDVFIEFEDFVEERRTVLVGRQERGTGDFISTGGRGIGFEAAYGLTLTAVTVFAQAAGEVKLKLLDADDTVLHSRKFDVQAGANRLKVEFLVPAGTGYRLDTQGSTAKLYRESSGDWPYVPGSSGDEVEGDEHLIKLVTGTQGQNSLQGYFFFYRWEIDYAVLTPAQFPDASPDFLTQTAAITRGDVRLAVRERLHSHRNLCEDFVNVCDLAKEEIAICADIEVSASADVEEVLAEIFYQIEKHVSPAVNFYTIDELLDRGLSMDRIFEGPALDHGFIDDEEFRQIERRCDLRTSDLIQIIMDVPDVISVKEISLLSFIDGEFRIQEDWVLELASDRFRVPDFSVKRSKVIFYRDELPYYANPGRVVALIEEKKAGDLHSKLKGHDRDLPIPVGEHKDLEDYYPIQNELPASYRVGQIRVPESDPPQRKAQSRQLKAFLLFFEQILANYLSQLAHVRQLFSWEKSPLDTYFTQTVREIAGVEDVYAKDFLSLPFFLDSIVEDQETAVDRRNRFLEHLIGRFAEDFTDYGLLMYSIQGMGAGKALIEDKEAFLKDYPRLSSQRGTGYDFRYPNCPSNLSGFQRRVYLLLGIEEVTVRRLAGHRFSLDMTLVDGAEQWRFLLEDEEGGVLFRSVACETRSSIEALLDFTLSIGGNFRNYKLRDDLTGFDLFRRCDEQAEDEMLGSTTSPFVLAEVLGYFSAYFDSEGFHVIEHILLRKRTSADPYLAIQLNAPGECDCPEVREPYSFRATVLLPSWPKRFKDLKFRRFVEDTLRAEAPAHVFLRICWISHFQMKGFEECYGPWTEGLASLEDQLGGCDFDRRSRETEFRGPTSMSGQLPLPKFKGEQVPKESEDPSDPLQYAARLERLITKLQGLVTVYPLARLHDCQQTSGDEPQVSLNNTSLGTF